MKSRIFMSMLVIALAAALVGGATMSIFTAQGETDEETYAAGTVKLSVFDLVSSTTIDIGKMAPGDTIEGEFKVENAGSLPLWFNVGYEASGFLFTGESEGGEEAVLNEENGDGEKHNATVTIIGKEFLPKELAPREKETISFKVHLPLEAGNEYQGAEGQLKFLVNAEQSAHNDNPFVGQEPEEPGEPDNVVE
jgi:spore coat-associated protein N